jgi:Flp pilus assembly protein CpaB
MPSLRRGKKSSDAQPELDLGSGFSEGRNRSRRIIFVGVILALAAGGASFYLIQRAQQQTVPTVIPKVNVVVAARTIAARKPIEPADVIVREVPADATNAQGVFTAPAEVIGRVSGVTILQGQLVTSNLFTFSAAGAVAILGPEETVGPDSPDWRAVSVEVPDDRAVGGILTVGSHVDMFVTATVIVPQTLLDSGVFYQDKSTKVTYQDVPILTRTGSLYVIKVTEQVAEEVAHLQASGTASFSMALRPEIDTRLVDASKLGATTNDIIERYGLPIPQVYPAASGPVPSPRIVGTPTPMPTPASPAPSSSP